MSELGEPHGMAAAIYAKDLERVAAFYEHVIGLTPVETDAGFMRLRGAGTELTIVRIRPDLAATIHVASPPAPRSETPIKLVFTVPSVEAVRATVAAYGGQLGPADAAWTWSGFLHLDGIDPEGNVLQLRERVDA